MNKPVQFGTILPTEKSLAVEEECFQRDRSDRSQAARRWRLDDLETRHICGETRYYQGDALYAVIGRDLRPKWFQVKSDGDYAVRGPCFYGRSITP